MEEIEKAPAKINLCLNVLCKRADNYHDMEMIMTPIDLNDRLSFSLLAKEIRIDSNSSSMPLNEKNIVYKTAELLREKYSVEKGVSIYIDKRIPIAAGLGGGSSDAAATLRALNRLWQLNLSLDELAAAGDEIGADVPFCVYNQTAYVTGKGENIEPIRSFPFAWVIIAKPRKGISSWTVFKDLNIAELPVYPVDKLKKAIENNDFEGCIRYTGNALESEAVKQNPQTGELKNKMLKFGAETALMSGTGPTVYGLTRNLNKANRIVNGLKGFCKDVFLVRTLN